MLVRGGASELCEACNGGISEEGGSEDVTRDFAEGVDVEASMSTSEVVCRTEP